MYLGRGGSWSMFVSSLNSSNPSKSMSTPLGFSIRWFQTASSRWFVGKYSDWINSSLRLRLSSDLNLLNFTKKAASKEISALSDAQFLRSLVQRNVLPIPARPTINTFLFFLTSRRSSKLFRFGFFSRDIAYVWSCFSLFPVKSYVALSGITTRFV